MWRLKARAMRARDPAGIRLVIASSKFGARVARAAGCFVGQAGACVYDERSIFPALPTVVGEAQKREGDTYEY